MLEMIPSGHGGGDCSRPRLLAARGQCGLLAHVLAFLRPASALRLLLQPHAKVVQSLVLFGEVFLGHVESVGELLHRRQHDLDRNRERRRALRPALLGLPHPRQLVRDLFLGGQVQFAAAVLVLIALIAGAGSNSE
ncbi:hypothetical protein [Streptomyces sp. NPDC055055]